MKRTILIALLSLSVNLLSGATPVGPIQKQIKGASILLSALNLTPEPPPLVESSTVVFDEAPAVGQVRSVGFEEASKFLLKHGLEATKLGWNPGQILVIQRESRALERAELLDHLLFALLDHNPSLDGDLKLDFLREPGEIQIPNEAYELSLPQPPSTGIRSRFILPFSIAVAGKPVFQASAALHASINKKVWVSTRRINRGEALQEQDFYLAERDLLTINGTPFDQEDLMDGLESKATLMKDRPLLKRYTGRIPVVARGDVVDAFIKRGAMSISMKVQTLDKGAPGDTIRVINPKSKKKLKGIVNDDSTIKIL